MIRYLAILMLFFFTGLGTAVAQYKREKDATIPLEHFYVERRGVGLRGLLTKFHIGISTGIGETFFSHKLKGYGVLQQSNSAPKLFSSTQPTNGYTQWTSTIAPTTHTLGATDFMVNSDTAKLGFRSKGINVPIKATLHIEIQKRFRIGGGYSFEYMHIGPFVPTRYVSQISPYTLPVTNVTMQKYFGMLGGMFYRYYEYAFSADAQIGAYKISKSFNRAVMRKSILVNIGVTAEKELSEYFRVFVRPSFDVKSYKLATTESPSGIAHHINAFYVNVGFTYRLPELRKCFIKDCRTQINHAHGNREYRSRAHPIFKKQNPHYGENYPVLIKYKGQNKKKLNPY